MKCSCCGTEEISQFKITPKSKKWDRVRVCVNCKKMKKREYDKNRYSENSVEIKETIKKYRNNNKDLIREQKRKYNSQDHIKHNNSLYHKEYRRKYRERRNFLEKERLQIDPDYAMRKRLRNNLLQAVKKQPTCNNRKPSSVFDLLGCDLAYFRQYFESKFKENMTWELFCNSDTIHIDHIIPCCRFDLSDLEQAKKCFHYSNLQPLWKWENLSKGSSYADV